MIHIQKANHHGILLPGLKIGFDYSGQEADHIFISHAHADHLPRNRKQPIYASEHTIKLMRLRGYSGKATPLSFGKPLQTENAQITLYPAGHILGSAMVYVQTEEGTVLYTGDYRTPPSPASEGFEMPEQVDHFITEATFSLPIYKWKSIDKLAEEIRSFAAEALDAGATPLFLAYNLGKAQEIMHLLASLDHPVQIHGAGYRMCKVYEQADINLGDYESYDRETCDGKILIAPVSAFNNGFASSAKKLKVAYCSGWAAREATRTQLTVDKLIPLSDHLDFFELINLCKELNPQKVYITHTPNPDVVRHYLDELGIDSVHLELAAEPDD